MRSQLYKVCEGSDSLFLNELNQIPRNVNPREFHAYLRKPGLDIVLLKSVFMGLIQQVFFEIRTSTWHGQLLQLSRQLAIAYTAGEQWGSASRRPRWQCRPGWRRWITIAAFFQMGRIANYIFQDTVCRQTRRRLHWGGRYLTYTKCASPWSILYSSLPWKKKLPCWNKPKNTSSPVTCVKVTQDRLYSCFWSC